MLMGLMAGCEDIPRRASQDDGRPVVLVTIPPLVGIVQEIVGEDIAVHCLMGAGSTPHNFSLKPSDMVKAEQALALVMVHPHLDDWASKLRVRHSIQLIPDEGEHEHAHHHDHGHDHGGVNPHFWSDPIKVQSTVTNIVIMLGDAMPDYKATFETNGEAFKQTLTELDAAIQEQVKPIQGKRAFFFHPSWAYFLERYGIKAMAYIETVPGKPMTPKQMRDLLELAVQKDVSAIFNEVQLPEKPALHLGKETGLPVYTLDPLGTPGESYAALIERNLSVLLEGLQ